MDCDVVRFDSRIDFVIIKNSIITKNITLLQNSFGFETYVRNEADKIIEIIKKLDKNCNIKLHYFLNFFSKPVD